MEQDYFTLAKTALEQYEIEKAKPVFVAHNAGIVFRIETDDQTYLLKIHKRVGNGKNPSYEQLEAGSHWLSELSNNIDIEIQTPLPTKTGVFTGSILYPLTDEPVYFTLQKWLDGELPNGDFTLEQAGQIGELMAHIHVFSSTYTQTNHFMGMQHDMHELENNINLLCESVQNLLSKGVLEIITRTGNKIKSYMQEIGTQPNVWGAVHGDLHYDNLLIFQGKIFPIDFEGLRIAHYMYDMGVTLYHCFHQGNEFRRKFCQAYENINPLKKSYEKYIDAFIVYAAIDNLAWNSTIPAQVQSSLFQKNLGNFINSFCSSLLEEKSLL